MCGFMTKPVILKSVIVVVVVLFAERALESYLRRFKPIGDGISCHDLDVRLAYAYMYWVSFAVLFRKAFFSFKMPGVAFGRVQAKLGGLATVSV
mgnify:CR=1 FL=1